VACGSPDDSMSEDDAIGEAKGAVDNSGELEPVLDPIVISNPSLCTPRGQSPSGTQACCAGLVSIQGVCEKACSADSQCATAEFCGHTNGVYWCKPDKNDGENCDRNAACKGAHCVNFEDGNGQVCTSLCNQCNGSWSGGACAPTFQGAQYCYQPRTNAQTCAYSWHCQTGDCGKDPSSAQKYCAVHQAGQAGRFVNVSEVWCGGTCSEGHDDKECVCTYRGSPYTSSSYFGATGLGCNEYDCCTNGLQAYAWVNWGVGQCTSQNEALGGFPPVIPQDCNADQQEPWKHVDTHDDVVCY
jgi:Dickkopf N-terminal cysteine-rich region